MPTRRSPAEAPYDELLEQRYLRGPIEWIEEDLRERNINHVAVFQAVLAMRDHMDDVDCRHEYRRRVTRSAVAALLAGVLLILTRGEQRADAIREIHSSSTKVALIGLHERQADQVVVEKKMTSIATTERGMPNTARTPLLIKRMVSKALKLAATNYRAEKPRARTQDMNNDRSSPPVPTADASNGSSIATLNRTTEHPFNMSICHSAAEETSFFVRDLAAQTAFRTMAFAIPKSGDSWYIRDLTGAEAARALTEMKPVRYVYNVDPTQHDVGFIAEAVPDLVATKDRTGLSSLDVIAILTQVVKDQQKTIDELKNRLDALEKKQ